MTARLLRPRRRGVARTVVLHGACAAGLALGLTSCTSEPAPEQSPAEASDNLSKRMFLTPETTACIRKVLEARPELASALNLDDSKQASRTRLDEFLAGVRPCLPAPVLAEAYTKIAPVGVVVNDAQTACIRDTIINFDEPTRDQLIMLAAGTPGADPIELGKPIAVVTQKCNITSPVGFPNATSDTVGPGGGATVITRGP